MQAELILLLMLAFVVLLAASAIGGSVKNDSSTPCNDRYPKLPHDWEWKKFTFPNGETTERVVCKRCQRRPGLF